MIASKIIFCVLALMSIVPLCGLRAQEADSNRVLLFPPILINGSRTDEVSMAPYGLSWRVVDVDGAESRLGLSEILAGIPGVEVQDRFNFAVGDRISMRGFGARTQFGVRGIKVFVDGLPATLADGQTTLDHVDLGAVRRLVVLRGPASAIYGNASGGVIRIETAPLDPGGRGLEMRAGGDGFRRVQGSSSGRTDGAFYSVDVTRRSYDGYREHSKSEHSRLTASASKTVGDSELRVSVSVVDFDALNPGSLNASQLAANRDAANGFNVVQGTRKDVTQGQLGVAWRRRGGVELDFTVYGLFRKLDNPIPVRVIDLDRTAAGARGEFSGSAALGAFPVSWVLGASTDYQRDSRRNFANEAGSRGALTLDQLEGVLNVAPFVQAALEVTERVNLHGALRYDRVRFDVADRFLADGDDSGGRTMHAWSPSVGIAFQLASGSVFYSNFSTAFETPTTTELANRPGGSGGFNTGLQPQRTRSVELGWRGSIGSYVRVDLGAYRAVVTDELIPFEAESTGRTFFRNAGSAIHRGVELGASLERPLFRLNVTYTFQDIRFDRFSVGGEVYDGNEIPGSTPHRSDFQLSYTPPGWFLTLRAVTASRVAVNDANSEFSPSHVLLNLRVGAQRIRLAGLVFGSHVGVNNVFDRNYISALAVNAFGGRYFEPGPGRMIFWGGTVGSR